MQRPQFLQTARLIANIVKSSEFFAQNTPRRQPVNAGKS